MNLQKIRKQNQPKIMIIPMIDIIFFLLIFFMISTLYMSEQKAMPLQLPPATSAEPIPEQTIAIMILSDGKIVVDQNEFNADTFPTYLLKLRQSRPDIPLFVLHANKQSQYGNIVFVLDKLKSAGLTRVAFATSGKAD